MVSWQATLNKISSLHVVGLGTGILLVSYTLVYLFDMLNVGGARSLYAHHQVPLLWDLIFQEHGPVEYMQWLFLGLFAVTSYRLADRLMEQGEHGPARFWGIFAIGGVFMLMEDALNIRHALIRQQISDWVIMNTVETLYFATLAALPVLAVVLYGKYIREHRRTVILLGLGFLFYGSAALLSGPGDLLDEKLMVGNVLYETTATLGGEELREIYEQTDARLKERYETGFMDIRYRLIDFLLEESLELLGATFLLASAVSYRKYIRLSRDDS